LQSVLQPPAVGAQGFGESVQGIVLVPVPVALRAQLIEAVIPLSSPALKLLSTVNEMREKTESGNARAQKQQGKTSNSTMRARTLKIYHAGPAWIRRASFNVLLRGPVVSKLLPQRLLGLDLVEVGRRHIGRLPLSLQARHGSI
jgi:hypothetical protein